jgi:Domain of unknown function (DUF4263)
VLGYSKFLSEQPVPKRDAFGSIAKFKDRPDILAARKSDFASNHLYIDIVELKAIGLEVSNENSPQRWSHVVGAAVSQMASYENELIESADFRADLSAIGLNIARPRKILVFGRDKEFIDRPHDWELLQHQFRTNQITHYTVDHILQLCERVLDEQWGGILSSIVPPDHLGLLNTGNRTLTLESLNTQLRATEGRPTEMSELIWNVNHNKLMESLTLTHVQTIVAAINPAIKYNAFYNAA